MLTDAHAHLPNQTMLSRFLDQLHLLNTLNLILFQFIILIIICTGKHIESKFFGLKMFNFWSDVFTFYTRQIVTRGMEKQQNWALDSFKTTSVTVTLPRTFLKYAVQ